jgi:hypothetical protein
MARWTHFALAGVLGTAAILSGACSSSNTESAASSEQHLDPASEEKAAAKAALDAALRSRASYQFDVTDLDDHVEIVAKKAVASRTLAIQIALMATASMHPGEEPPTFIKNLASGQSQSLTLSFTGEFIGQDANGAEYQVAATDVSDRMLDSQTPTMCGTRTHNAIADLVSASGESLRVVVGLSITYPATSGDSSGGSSGGLRPMAETTTGDHQPAPPADGKACPDRKGYGFVFYADPECGQDRCYNLTWVKQKRTVKVAVDVDGKKVGGSGEQEIEVENPVWVAGNCSTEFSRWSFPSYYYCKCNTPQLGKPQ